MFFNFPLNNFNKFDKRYDVLSALALAKVTCSAPTTAAGS